MVKRLVIVLSILVGLVSICISGCETQEQEVKKLIKALQHKNSQVRRAAAGKLGEIGEDAKDAVPALTIALQDESRDVRTSAAGALGAIGKSAIDAAPALIKTLQNPEVRWHAEEALAKIRNRCRTCSNTSIAKSRGPSIYNRGISKDRGRCKRCGAGSYTNIAESRYKCS